MVRLANRLTKHLLDVALSHLKENARHAIPEESLGIAYQRFLEHH